MKILSNKLPIVLALVALALLFCTVTSYAQQGSISSAVKKIDCDKTHPYANLLKSNGATFDLRNVAIEECSNSQILFRCRLTKGISDKSGRIIIEPIFNELSSIDSESKLAKAKYSTGNNTYTEVYINEQGVFVIIKGDASTW